MRKIFLTIIGSLCVLTLNYGPAAIQYYQNSSTTVSIAHAEESYTYEPARTGSDVSGTGPGSDVRGTGPGSDVRGTGPGSDVRGTGPGVQAPTFDIQLTNPLKGYTTLCQVLEAILRLITELGAIVAVIFIILSGFKFITAQGNMTKLNDAKHSFYTALLGTAILLGASVIAQIVVKTVFSITNKTNTDVCSI